MKIIDFDRKGNVVRYYLGDDDCQDYRGDDWNDAPYDCNAGTVYKEFQRGYRDVAYPFDDKVLEPCCGGINCGWSKNDLKKRKTPCLIVVPAEIAGKSSWCDNYEYWIGADGVKRIYLGDPMEPDVVFGEQPNN